MARAAQARGPLEWGRAAVAAVLVLGATTGCHGSRPGRWLTLDHGPSGGGPFDGGAGVTVTVSGLLGGAAAPGGPWLAVGSQIDGSGVQSPRAWSSPDGRAWSRDAVVATSFDGPLDRFLAVARRGPAAVVAGQTQSPSEGNIRPSMWYRTADGAWHEVPAPRELFGGERGGGLVTVTSAPDGFVLAGGWTGATERFDVGVWTSTDGTSWPRVDGDSALTSGPQESIRVIGAAGNADRVVLTGESDLGAARRGAAWWSVDGRHWHRVAVGDSASLQHVVAVPGRGFVAVGLRSDGSPAAWRSNDGTQWQPVGALPGPAVGPVALTAEAAGTGPLMAGGVAGGRVQLWQSASSDGSSWHAVNLPPDLRAVTSATTVAVAVGPVAGGPVLVAVNRPEGVLVSLLS